MTFQLLKVPTPVTTRDRVGDRLGKWTLQALIGAGGNATVYMATDRRGRPAAVKVMSEALADSPIARARLAREAYVAKVIAHPGIVKVIEDGLTEDKIPYLVMELLEGETVEQRRQRKHGRLPVDEVFWIAERTLDVLAAAHAKGVLHRDIKPDNLFITSDQQVKVLDFGIARFGPEDEEITGEGSILGTLGYMPPEQARGDTQDIDVRSDLWALGATMFTLLSARRVHEGGDIRAALEAAATKPPPPLREVAPDMPDEIADLVDYALSLDSQVRWPNAAMMRMAVRRAYARMKRQSRRLWRGDDPFGSDPGLDFVRIDAPPIEAPPASSAMRVRVSQSAQLEPRRKAAAQPPAVAPSEPPRASRLWWLVAVALTLVIALVAIMALAR